MSENFFTLAVGGGVIAVIQMAELKDIVTVAVGIVTIVCLIYNTFFKKKKD